MATGGIFMFNPYSRFTDEEDAKAKADLHTIMNLLYEYYEIYYFSGYGIDLISDNSYIYDPRSLHVQYLPSKLIKLITIYNWEDIAIDTVDNIIEKIFVYRSCKDIKL